ncbi:hypothetical protein Ancab_040587 [Ancistrocladus abbreviatus]
MDRNLMALGVVDVQYKRIPCVFKEHNLSLRVEESSNYPNYLVVKILYQGGQTDITGIVVHGVASARFFPLRHNYGAIWSTNTVPYGPLQFRFGITSGNHSKAVLTKNPLPAHWKPGVIYDTGVQIEDISDTSCDPPCNDVQLLQLSSM